MLMPSDKEQEEELFLHEESYHFNVGHDSFNADGGSKMKYGALNI